MTRFSSSHLKALGLSLCFGFGSVAQAADLTVYTAVLPPFSNGFEAEHHGITHDMVEEMGKRAGLDVDIQYVPFPRAIKMTTSEPNSYLIPPVRSPAREPQFNWVTEMMPSNQVFVTVGAPVNSLEEARKLSKIAVLRGGVMEGLLKKLEFTNLHAVPSSVQAAKQVHAGRADAWFAIDVETFGVLRDAGFELTDFTVGDSVREAQHWLASNHEFDADMAAKMAQAMKDMIADGTQQAILDQYMQ